MSHLPVLHPHHAEQSELAGALEHRQKQGIDDAQCGDRYREQHYDAHKSEDLEQHRSLGIFEFGHVQQLNLRVRGKNRVDLTARLRFSDIGFQLQEHLNILVVRKEAVVRGEIQDEIDGLGTKERPIFVDPSDLDVLETRDGKLHLDNVAHVPTQLFGQALMDQDDGQSTVGQIRYGTFDHIDADHVSAGTRVHRKQEMDIVIHPKLPRLDAGNAL